MTITSADPEARVSRDLQRYRIVMASGAAQLWPARDDADALARAVEYFGERPGVALHRPDGGLLARSPGWEAVT